MEKWKDLDVKNKVAIITAVVAFLVGWGLTIAGFIVPPIGEIADSILWILGQALIYTASVLGIGMYFGNETKRLKGEIKNYMRHPEEIEETED